MSTSLILIYVMVTFLILTSTAYASDVVGYVLMKQYNQNKFVSEVGMFLLSSWGFLTIATITGLLLFCLSRTLVLWGYL